MLTCPRCGRTHDDVAGCPDCGPLDPTGIVTVIRDLPCGDHRPPPLDVTLVGIVAVTWTDEDGPQYMIPWPIRQPDGRYTWQIHDDGGVGYYDGPDDIEATAARWVAEAHDADDRTAAERTAGLYRVVAEVMRNWLAARESDGALTYADIADGGR